MAFIRKLKSGYQVRWREGGRESPLLSCPVVPTVAAAKLLKSEVETKQAARRAIRPFTHLPLTEIVERWIASRISHGNDPHWTERAAARIRRIVAHEGWQTTFDITPSSIEQWRSRSYCARAGSEIRALLRWAKDHLGQPVDSGTLVGLRPPRKKRTYQALLNEAVVKSILSKSQEIGQSFHALLHCLSTYGWRPITAAKIRIADIDLEGGRILLRDLKGGGDELMHPLSTTTIDLLAPLLFGRERSDPLFLHPRTGKGWSIDRSGSIPEFYRRWSSQKVYDLKRWAISHMLAQGLPPQEVALFTGHKTMSQVLQYARTNEEKARAALTRFA